MRRDRTRDDKVISTSARRRRRRQYIIIYIIIIVSRVSPVSFGFRFASIDRPDVTSRVHTTRAPDIRSAVCTRHHSRRRVSRPRTDRVPWPYADAPRFRYIICSHEYATCSRARAPHTPRGFSLCVFATDSKRPRQSFVVASVSGGEDEREYNSSYLPPVHRSPPFRFRATDLIQYRTLSSTYSNKTTDSLYSYAYNVI